MRVIEQMAGHNSHQLHIQMWRGPGARFSLSRPALTGRNGLHKENRPEDFRRGGRLWIAA